MYKTMFFKLQELVPPDVYNKYKKTLPERGLLK